ncbi:permease [Paenibacillus arenosi]|uniref:Permease n=1 Tax=Paenibacillus arenosi TaxID=2774142 RepID=A0ABR9ATS9_9BACL|nr:permease [Paenibacillus arenosi]MBD8497515.1 permease [Paenibacillus arenosi]
MISSIKRSDDPAAHPSPRLLQLPLLLPLLLLLTLVGVLAAQPLASNAELWRTFTTVFVSILLEAMPFLLLGIILSSLVHVFIAPDFFRNMAVKWPRPVLVVFAALGGILLPICECGMIPVVRKFMQKGLPPAAAVTYMCAAPILNPIVYASTATAFPSAPWMAVGRMAVAFFVVLTIGWIVSIIVHRRHTFLLIHPESYRETSTHAKNQTYIPLPNKLRHAADHMGKEWMETTVYLTFGACITALFQTSFPRSLIVDASWMNPALEHIGLMTLAYLLSLCSTSDAFIAASFTSMLAPASLLSFLVFGPMMDLKTTLMMMTVFRKRFILLLACLLLLIVPLFATIFISIVL